MNKLCACVNSNSRLLTGAAIKQATGSDLFYSFRSRLNCYDSRIICVVFATLLRIRKFFHAAFFETSRNIRFSNQCKYYRLFALRFLSPNYWFFLFHKKACEVMRVCTHIDVLRFLNQNVFSTKFKKQVKV